VFLLVRGNEPSGERARTRPLPARINRGVCLMDKVEQATAAPGETRDDIRPFCRHDILARVAATMDYACGCGAVFTVTRGE
jgi:hypothetical protein